MDSAAGLGQTNTLISHADAMEDHAARNVSIA